MSSDSAVDGLVCDRTARSHLSVPTLVSSHSTSSSSGLLVYVIYSLPLSLGHTPRQAFSQALVKVDSLDFSPSLQQYALVAHLVLMTSIYLRPR